MGKVGQQASDEKLSRGHDGLPLVLLLFGLTTHFAYLTVAPPGVHGDSARLGLHAFDFLQRGIWPFYIYHQFAPNPLIVVKNSGSQRAQRVGSPSRSRNTHPLSTMWPTIRLTCSRAASFSFPCAASS